MIRIDLGFDGTIECDSPEEMERLEEIAEIYGGNRPGGRVRWIKCRQDTKSEDAEDLAAIRVRVYEPTIPWVRPDTTTS